MQDILEFSQVLTIILEEANNILPAPTPKHTANKRQLLTAFKPSKKFPLANCSETIHVQARLSP